MSFSPCLWEMHNKKSLSSHYIASRKSEMRNRIDVACKLKKKMAVLYKFIPLVIVESVQVNNVL